MDKKNLEIVRIFTIAALIIIVTVLVAFKVNMAFEAPTTCNLCHEMKIYVASYNEPEPGSIILKHEFSCLGCHSRTNLNEARSAILNEIAASGIHKITGIKLKINSSTLANNCSKCHTMKDAQHLNITINNTCRDCHWAHKQNGRNNIIEIMIIPYGPHMNQTCEICHGKTFQIPRCINCHAGHGDQKLENELCLVCHVDPHLPKKPGILSNNTVIFTGNLSFSVCQPCHEKEYFELINSLSLHNDMQTCTKCHKSHGYQPRCNTCHPVMSTGKHPDFNCNNCHKTYDPIKTICQDCHGTTHEWNALTAIWNPK